MFRKRQSGFRERLPRTRRPFGGTREPRRGRAWAPECLEDRILLSGLTYTVVQTTDTGAGSGLSGDLRYTINQANANPGSTIQFAVSGTIALGSALPDVTADVTIDGPGASNLTIEGTSGTRVVTINGANVAISGLTLADGTANGAGAGAGGAIDNTNGTLSVTACTFAGNAAGDGGAIDNDGQLTINDSTFIGNTGSGGSGAIWNGGTLTVTDSTFSNNSANASGGAITNDFNLTVSGCTFSGNTVGVEGRGGAIDNYFGIATISNSTFVNNSATLGGAIDSYYSSASYGGVHAIATLTDVTITGSSGGGIDNEGDTVGDLTLTNSLIAGNSGGDVVGLVNPFNCTNNLIGDGSQSRGIGNGSDGNQVGTSANPINPKLGALGNNGGPTQTLALLAGSPALGGGSGAATTDTDQRGVPRGRVLDIGAYQATATQLVVTGFPSPTAPGISHAFTVNAVDPFGQLALDASGPVNFSSSDPSAALPTGQSLAGGAGTFSASLSTPGIQSITASAGGLSGSQTDITVNGISATASFLKQDTTTEGNWIGTYGSQGYELIANATSLPSYATVTPSGQSVTTWTANTTDPRALQQAGGTGRIAATWYSFTSFTINVNITDGNTHDLELYFLDWDTTTRVETVQITDTASGTLLNSEKISAFHSGVYFDYAISGNITIKITNSGGANAVLSGLFFDSPPAIKSAPTITWANPASIVYGTPLSSTQLDATASVAGNFVYTPASGTILNAANGQSLSATFTPTDTTDYSTVTATALINVLQATPTIAWANPAGIVSGTPLSSTQLDAASSWTIGGVAGSVAGNFSYNPAAGTVLAVGNQTLSVTFTPTDKTDFTSATFSVTITVTASASSSATFLEKDTTTEGNWIGTYGSQGYELIANATSLPSYATVTPSGQSVTTWTASTTDPRALQQAGGTGRIAATWYSFTSFTINVNITDGNTHDLELYFLDWDTTTRVETVQITDTASGTLLNSEKISAFHSGVYFDYAISGNITIKITNSGGANAVLSGLFFDSPPAIKSAPTITWANPASIVYGTPLSSTQLDATASVAGNFVYTPASGTIVNAANGQSLSATFTPTDTTDYSTVTATALINVLQATPTITWANPASIVSGTPLSSTQLDAASSWTIGGVASSVAGSFSYNPPSGTVLAVGNQTLSVTFTPTDKTDFTSATFSVTITVTASASSSATFLEKDTTTEGNWIGTYGSQGYEIIANATSLPSYATVTPSGQSVTTWTANTTDPRALQQAGGTGRIAATWYSFTSFTINVNITDGNTHDLELYFLDWDTTTRVETVQITDTASGTLLNSEKISAFHSGVYFDYAISGNITIKITNSGGANAVLSGLFFDGATTPNVAQTNVSVIAGANASGNRTSLDAMARSNPSTAGSGNGAGLAARASSVASQVVRVSPEFVTGPAGSQSDDPLANPLANRSASTATHDLALEDGSQAASIAPAVTAPQQGAIAVAALDAILVDGSYSAMIRKADGRH